MEAHNPEHSMFGFPQPAQLLQELRDDPSLIDFLLKQLTAFTCPAREQEDDITLVTLQHSLGYGKSEIATRSTTKLGETMTQDSWQRLAEWSVTSELGIEGLLQPKS